MIEPPVQLLSAGSSNGENGSPATSVVNDGGPAVRPPETSSHRQLQMLAAERTVQIPPAEAQGELRQRISPAVQSLQDELGELRAQLEGLQLELPELAVPDAGDDHV